MKYSCFLFLLTLLALLPSSARADAHQATIVVEGDPGLTLYLAASGDAPRPMCDAPCRIPSSTGTYDVGVGKGTDDNDPVMARESLDVSGPTRIRIHRTGTQTLGWVFVVGGVLLAGTIATATPLLMKQVLVASQPDPNGPASGGMSLAIFAEVGLMVLAGLGGIVALAGIVHGGVLLMKRDEAKFSVE